MEHDINRLVGDTITEVIGAEPDSERVEFRTAAGKHFLMFHSQD